MELTKEENHKVFHNLFKHLKEYIEAKFDLAVLNAQDRLGDILSSLAAVLILIFAGGLAFILINIALAMFLGKFIHNVPLGFLILGGVYILVAGIVWLNKNKWIKYPVTDALLSKINIHEEG